jgi:hypothetical protein
VDWGNNQKERKESKGNSKRKGKSRGASFEEPSGGGGSSGGGGGGGGGSGGGGGRARSGSMDAVEEGGGAALAAGDAHGMLLQLCGRPLLFPSLVSLRIERCHQLAAVVLEAPALQRCALRDCRQLRLVSLSAPSARSLDCFGCGALEAVSWLEAADVPLGSNYSGGVSLRQLSFACFRHCGALEEAFFFRLVDHCRQLAALDVLGTVLSPTASRNHLAKGAEKGEGMKKIPVHNKKSYFAQFASEPSMMSRNNHTKVKTKAGLRKIEASRAALVVVSTKQQAADKDKQLGAPELY